MTFEQIANVAEHLRGTTLSLEEGFEREGLKYDDATPGDLAELDQIVFLCDVCGWWCEISDEAETEDDAEQVCIECAES